MKRIASAARHQTIRRFARFVLVGLINTLFGYGLYAALILIGTPPQPALFLSFFVGVLWNYFTTARFVFRVGGFSRLPAYAACYIAVYLLNAYVLHGVIRAGLSPLTAQALLTPLAAVLTFVLVSFVMRPRPA
ncbi:MAG: GtrA family protein [Pseudomonadota bacterium]|uniref:Putative flippase GtrA n=1 Tax=Actibacterium naphthalenivorans TaxID=1614693 RepID=A0A840CC32_9RHOB|nr:MULTISPECIES: GtrA family protein [Actibacterium]MBB4022403.1 putative flippase GtrA [Actibacterium naphthalenivorans]MDY6859629.1 GtrA family protein [Pseudomonadota bacterium]